MVLYIMTCQSEVLDSIVTPPALPRSPGPYTNFLRHTCPVVFVNHLPTIGDYRRTPRRKKPTAQFPSISFCHIDQSKRNITKRQSLRLSWIFRSYLHTKIKLFARVVAAVMYVFLFFVFIYPVSEIEMAF